MYSLQTFYYLQFIAALQGWVFGIRYWQSATESSLKQSWLNPDKILRIGAAGTIAYSAI